MGVLGLGVIGLGVLGMGVGSGCWIWVLGMCAGSGCCKYANWLLRYGRVKCVYRCTLRFDRFEYPILDLKFSVVWYFSNHGGLLNDKLVSEGQLDCGV